LPIHKEYDHKITTQQFLDLIAQELKPYDYEKEDNKDKKPAA